MNRNQIIVKFLTLLVLLLLLSCSTVNLPSSSNYIPDWEEPTNSHSLALQQSDFAQILWEKQIYVLNNVLERVECVSSEGILVLVGSTNSKEKAKILALEGKSGNMLWSLDDAGILVNSEHGIFIGSGINIYLVEPSTGLVKWKKQFPSARHITNMMYYDHVLYVNATGINSYFVIRPDGQIESTYKQPSDFYSKHTDIPFDPYLPFGIVISEDIYVEQTGSGLYSGYVYDRLSNELLWQVEKDSISNFISMNEHIFWISRNDQIKVVDNRSGNVIESIEITPSINFFDPSDNKQHLGYYLCGDSQLGIVYIILGDSRQVFALDIQF